MPHGRRSGRNSTLPRAPRGIVPLNNNLIAEAANGNQAGAQRARNMPMAPSAGPATQRTRNSGNGGNGGNAPGATERLSIECQRRSFNPQWILVQGDNGMFSCDVMLLGHIVKGGRQFRFRFPEEAKSAVASKALDIIRTWPTTAEVAGEKCRNHIAGVMTNRDHGRGRRGVNTEGEQFARVAAPSGPEREREIDRAINDLIQILRDDTEQTLTDPIATRVLVESLAAGMLSAQQQRDRSRSPRAMPRVAGQYRERFPPGLAGPPQSTALHSPAASETASAGYPQNANRGSSQPAWRRRRDDSYRPNYPEGPQEQQRRNQFGQ